MSSTTKARVFLNHGNWKSILSGAIAMIAVALPLAQSQDDHNARVKEAAAQSAKAAKVFDEIMRTPDKAIPQDLLDHAKAIAIPAGHQGSIPHWRRRRTRRDKPAHQHWLEQSGILSRRRWQRRAADWNVVD